MFAYNFKNYGYFVLEKLLLNFKIFELDLSKKQHIIWDYNGTLLNDRWLCVEVINKMLHQRNKLAITDLEYQQLFDFPVRDYYAKVGFDFNIEPFEIVGKEFIDDYDARQHECVLHSDARSVIQQLSGMGLKQSVLSARQLSSLKNELNIFGLNGYFMHIAGLDSFHADGKEQLGLELVNKIELPKDQIVMIGDTVHDYDVAVHMGIDIVLLAHGHHHKSRLEKCNATVLSSIQELEQLLCTGQKKATL